MRIPIRRRDGVKQHYHIARKVRRQPKRKVPAEICECGGTATFLKMDHGTPILKCQKCGDTFEAVPKSEYISKVKLPPKAPVEMDYVTYRGKKYPARKLYLRYGDGQLVSGGAEAWISVQSLNRLLEKVDYAGKAEDVDSGIFDYVEDKYINLPDDELVKHLNDEYYLVVDPERPEKITKEQARKWWKTHEVYGVDDSQYPTVTDAQIMDEKDLDRFSQFKIVG